MSHPNNLMLLQDIHDRTATNDVALRRTLYLTIMSSAGYEEAGHKLMKVGLQPGQEPELCRMIVDCCSQERTFLRFYALLAQRFCAKFYAYRRVSQNRLLHLLLALGHCSRSASAPSSSCTGRSDTFALSLCSAPACKRMCVLESLGTILEILCGLVDARSHARYLVRVCCYVLVGHPGPCTLCGPHCNNRSSRRCLRLQQCV
jgi:MA3 domain